MGKLPRRIGDVSEDTRAQEDEMFRQFESHTYALLRIVAGFLFMMHGTQKLLGWPPKEGGGDSLSPMMTAAGVIEIVAGLMILLGFFTGIAAFIASGEMAAAFFIAHLPQGWNPLLNGGETAALYSFIFLFMAARGSGIWSIDAARGRSSVPRTADGT